MGAIDLSDQMKVSYEVDGRSKLRLNLPVFCDFLDINVISSKVVYNKIQSSVAMSSMDFHFSLAHLIIGNFCNQKRAVPTSRPLKRSKGEKAMPVDHLSEFAATCARCAYSSAKKVMTWPAI